MVGSRLDASRDPLGPILVYMAELKRGGKVDAWMTRAAAFAHRDIAPAMLERLVAIDATFQGRLAKALTVSMESHGVRHDGTLSGACAAMGENRMHAIGATIGIELVTGELCRKAGIASKPLAMQAIATAATAAHISQHGKCCDAGSAAIAGLFAKIGVPLLAGFYGEKYGAAWQSLAGGACSIADAERTAFGVSHETVGAASNQFWSLPPEVVEAMNPNRASLDTLSGVSLCVGVASVIVHQMGLDGGAANTPPDLPAGVLERLGISESTMAALADEITAELQLAGKMLEA